MDPVGIAVLLLGLVTILNAAYIALLDRRVERLEQTRRG